MVIVGLFEDELALLKRISLYGSYVYNTRSDSFSACTTIHFKEIREKDKYGVYIVRQQDPREVLYIGKGGTVDSQGNFKGQNVPRRLKNVKRGDVKRCDEKTPSRGVV